MPVVETFEVVQPGSYRAQIGEITEIETSYGNSYRWDFWPIIEDGSQQKVTDLSTTSFTTRSKAYKWTAAALNRQPAAGENIDFGTLAGKWVQIVVSINENGYNKVEMVSPDTQPAPAAVPAQAPPAAAPAATVNATPETNDRQTFQAPDERPF
jgi:hypothetical protein